MNKLNLIMNQTLWGQLEFEADKITQLKYGNCTLWLKRELDEIWLAHQHHDGIVRPAHTENPELPIDWRRWAVKEHIDSLWLEPRMPNLPVVVRPESDFHLLPGAQVKIYVLVPIWIRVRIADKPQTKIVKVPSEILSKTWFGSQVEGESCYWISSKALRTLSHLVPEEHHCICPVEIKNTSDEKLLISKFCLRVKYLALYQKEGQLWANETKVFYKGIDETSEIKVTPGAPKEALGAEIISPPIERPDNNFTMKSFNTLKNWYDRTSSLVSINRLYHHFNGAKK